MTTQVRETMSVQGHDLVARFKQLLHEGNIRRVVVKQDDDVIVEFPLTVGVAGAVVAPMVAALGAVAALVTHCTIEVERTDTAEVRTEDRQTEDLAPPGSDALSEPAVAAR